MTREKIKRKEKGKKKTKRKKNSTERRRAGPEAQAIPGRLRTVIRTLRQC
jgi:hypothetical protein